MANLRSQLNTLAATFANQIMATLQGASLHELVASGGGGNVGNGRRARAVTVGDREPPPLSTPVARKGKNGRLPRRSADEIAAVLNKVVLLVKTHREGMRAEEIRSKLGLLPKEMPRVLKRGDRDEEADEQGAEESDDVLREVRERPSG
jgi:hypothetical protein